MRTTEARGKIGLLPFYLKLYDQVCDKGLTDQVKAFAGVIKTEYEKRGVEVVANAPCTGADDFAAAVRTFEEADVDAMVTLHLAYSPSLESIEAVGGSRLPVIVLDTTPDARFGFDQTADRIMFNHGIHGVQDFCNLLLRHGKEFTIEAGHWQTSDVIDRTVSALRGYRAARLFRQARVGIIGEPFKGMGDFAVPRGVMTGELGLTVVSASSEEIAKRMPALDAPEVKAEVDADVARFSQGRISAEGLRATEAAGLGLRRWIDEERLTALTINFQNIAGAPGLPVVPFLEASKAMARGLGYGGEGDILTAALCGAMRQVCRETTFTEMFCPDWDGERIFMSHMGEVNLDVLARTPVLEQRPYPFSAADEPVIASGCLKAGAALLLNVAPRSDTSFALIAVEVELQDSGGEEAINSGMRGWLRPPMPVDEFLTQYSRNGGTHHKVLCYGMDLRTAEAFAKAMQWTFVTIHE